MSAQGMTYDQIAEACHVVPNTVRKTFAEVRKRLKATTTTQAVVLAIAREEIGLTHDGQCYVPIWWYRQ